MIEYFGHKSVIGCAKVLPLIRGKNNMIEFLDNFFWIKDWEHFLSNPSPQGYIFYET